MRSIKKIGSAIAKWTYKSIRSILFSLTLVVVGLYIFAYILLAIPSFTNWVKDKAIKEISLFLGSTVEIKDFEIYPFNEAKILGLEVYDPQGRKCLYVEKIGAGISLWNLITKQEIDLTFGEIIGLDAKLIQEKEGGPLNIDFIIQAFSGNDKKEKKPFELSLKNVVLRKSKASFERPWLENKKIGKINLSDLVVTDLAADLTFPKISDKEFEIDLRRLSLTIPDIAKVNKIGFKGKYSRNDLLIQNFVFEMPHSKIALSDIEISLNDGETYFDVLKNKIIELEITNSYLTPADFSFLYSPLASFDEPLYMDVFAKGNISKINIERFIFGNPETIYLTFKGDLNDFSDIKTLNGDVKNLELRIRDNVFNRCGNSITNVPPIAKNLINQIGTFSLSGNFWGTMLSKELQGNLQIQSNLATINWEGNLTNKHSLKLEGTGDILIDNINLNSIFPNSPVNKISAHIEANGSFVKEDLYGSVLFDINNFEYRGKAYNGLSLNLNAEGDIIEGMASMNNAIAHMNANFSGNIRKENQKVQLGLNLEMLDLSQLMDMKNYKGYIISGDIDLNAEGSDIDTLTGLININDLSFTAPDKIKHLNLNQLTLQSSFLDNQRRIDLSSDWMDLHAEGNFKYQELPTQIKNLVASIFPSFINKDKTIHEDFTSSLDFGMIIKKDNTLTDFFNLPIKLLVPVNIEGSIDGNSNMASFTLDLPYLQQGKDKLIYDSRIVANINGNDGFMNALITTTLPVKKGDLALNINIFGHNDAVSSEIHWVNTENSDFKGLLSLATEFSKNSFTQKPEINTEILPSVARMGSQDWYISRSNINYYDKNLEVEGFKIWHDDQRVEIEGKASSDYQDVMRISLADIDVDYIFGMLQINYVTFGGVATGEVFGRSLFSGNPVAETEGVLIKEFTYNGANLGECLATSRWKNDQKKIEIGADITKDGKLIVNGEGGIWLGKDSLSFDLHARNTPVEFVQPFMSAFSSRVTGHADGDVKLFGTFHDIDMTGKVYADSVAVLLDFTNTVYQGSDSVIFKPGQIEIPNFRLEDKFGNSAILTGELNHRYFHDPTFTCRLTDAKNLLCYDTNAEINPDWYGTLYGTGTALVKGIPGMVDISADMTVGGNSNFTFVLNDTQYAQDYQFLTFTDKKKEASLEKENTLPDDVKAIFKKRMQTEETAPSGFGIDIRATITPQALFTLVMDPAAGDKITARGKGAMQVKYESSDDEMTMYGKYEIDEGNYNFSLQEIILRDFKIKDGSSISFNGNPLNANLDISATYRVNTNLTDLDKSFSTDRDLNRTNVPVDAVLSVNGNMQNPDITFDIELPTLTQDVERKVKSIISTEDMMNRQIIYLLALNRFYTPEYMGAGSNGGELAAVASSTISSQLSNMLGQLTDKFSVSPSFRSDKGDFSDIEVDVALSSKLLNNRLLINGNFGYRDRSNSSTTFVGDFDVEYLLSKNGNLRLKAYNHFNDQNYYLREALTTQGLGVVYRKDFDNWFTFLKKNRKFIKNNIEETTDSLPINP